MPAAALVALLLALGVVACGGSDSDSTTGTAEQQSQAEGAGQGGDGESGGGDSSAAATSAGDADDFVPKEHDDSGGGAGQFKVKGGDNSVQEFGEEASAEELDAAAAALHNFLDARAEGNWAAACEYMSGSVVESFEKLAAQSKQIDDSSCGSILETLTNPAATQLLKEEAAKADVGSLRIEGGRAFIIYSGVEGTIMAMPMADEDGDWKVASLAGTPLS